jgi:uncharacterized membrane protein YfhO
MIAFCVGDAMARSYPFGSRTRNVNDLGNQYVPYHAHFWDMLHGGANGGLLLNWQSGYGSSFLPDLGAYTASPFALLVALFPRDRIDLALYVITVLKIGAAAAAMACLLLTLRPGRWWAAGLLGSSYALCGWTLMLASYNPMWLDGLIAFPLLCLVGEWARAGRRMVLSVGVVAICWFANFYTAYMATVAAALVLLARLATDRAATNRQRLIAAGRGSLSMVLGVALTAPVLMTIVKGDKLVYPLPKQDFQAVPWSDMLVRMLPGTYGFASPSNYIDTAALLLAFALPFHRAVPRRTRAVWTALAVVVAASFQWGPTHLFWYAFTTPNGSAYRETFALSGVLVIAAWFALAHGLPGWRPLACGAGVMAAVVAASVFIADDGLAGPSTYPLAGAGLVLAMGALLLFDRAQRLRRTVPAAIAVGLLIVTQVGQSAISNSWTDHKKLESFDNYAPWGQRQQWERDAIKANDAWPAYRTEPGRQQTVSNDPLEVGGQGAQYYSSLTSEVLTSTLASLGGGWTSRGRAPQSIDNPVTDVLLSVGARLHSPPDPHQRANPPQTAPPTVTHQAVPPMVTVRSAAPSGRYGPSPYRNQEMLLGSRVYTPGTIALHDSAGRPIHRRGDGFPVRNGRRGTAGSNTYRLDSACPAGNQIYFWAPNLMGTVALAGQQPVPFQGLMPSHRAAMARIGEVPASGRFTLWVHAASRGKLPANGLGCLDRSRLAAAEQRIAATAATKVAINDDGFHATLRPGTKGYAVLAAPAIKGWSCSADGRGSHAASSYLGLVAVPLGGGASSVSCSFTPPGLHEGEAAAGASLLAVIGITGYGWWRGRRRKETPGGDADVPGRQMAEAVVE